MFSHDRFCPEKKKSFCVRAWYRLQSVTPSSFFHDNFLLDTFLHGSNTANMQLRSAREIDTTIPVRPSPQKSTKRPVDEGTESGEEYSTKKKRPKTSSPKSNGKASKDDSKLQRTPVKRWSAKVKEEEGEEAPEKFAPSKSKRASRKVIEDDEDDEDSTPAAAPAVTKPPVVKAAEANGNNSGAEASDPEAESDEEEEKPEVAAKVRAKVQSTLKAIGKDPYPDWKAGEPVPYAALCTTFSKIELTTKRLEITAHCSLFLRQVLRLTPSDLLPTILLMINKLAADYAGIELGIGESLIMKAIGESTGRSLAVIKQDQNEIGDLGLVAAKSRSNQPTMFKPKALTVSGVHKGLLAIATIEGHGSQGNKVAGIKKLLSAADTEMPKGKGGKGVDITQDRGGPSEAKFIVRTLEGKLRLGLAERTVLVSLANAVTFHELDEKGGKIPSPDQLAKDEALLKSVYRYDHVPRLLGEFIY
jgi:DNA ligase-1